MSSSTSGSSTSKHVRNTSSPFGSGTPFLDESCTSTPPGVQVAVALGQFAAQQEFNKSLLRLTSILQKCIQGTDSSWLSNCFCLIPL
ncbi:hypothetical protein JB92DRAFT_3007742 [Gautieria morchelliformis]|nr:hypothetical protein JB92DRAFT_3007742 [Gautieria morchelliformis]